MVAANNKNDKNTAGDSMIIKALGMLYLCMYQIDLKTGLMEELSAIESIRERIGFTAIAREFLENMAYDIFNQEGRDEIRRFLDITTLPERMKDSTSICHEIIANVAADDKKDESWVRVTFLEAGRDKKGCLTKAVLIVQSIIEERKKEQEYKAKLKAAEEEREAINFDLTVKEYRIRKQQEALEQTNVLLSSLNGALGSYKWQANIDKDGHLSNFQGGEELLNFLGLATVENITSDALLKLVHPDDRERLYEAYRRAIDNDEMFREEYRIHTSSGEYIWVRCTGRAIKNALGIPASFCSIMMNINDYKLADLELKAVMQSERFAVEAERAVHEIIGSSSWCISYDEKGKYKSASWSEGVLSMVGYDKDNPLPANQPSGRELWYLLIHPDDKDRVLKTYFAILDETTGKKFFDVEYRLYKRNEGYRWYRTAGCVLRRDNGIPQTVYGLVVDIDDRKKAEQALKESNKQLKQLNFELDSSKREIERHLALIESLSVEYETIVLLNVGKDGSVRLMPYRMNKDAIKLCESIEQNGLNYTEAMDYYLSQRAVAEDRQRIKDASALEKVRENTRGGKLYILNYRRIDALGSTKNFQVVFSKAPLDEHNGERYLLGFRDVDQVINKEKMIMDALEAAKQANIAKTNFLHNMSHDIRTPMNGIIGYTTLAEEYVNMPEVVKQYLKKIKVSGNHLLSLINDVLDMSRIESGHIQLDNKPADLIALIDELVSIVQSDVELKQMRLSVDISKVKNRVAVYDRLRLKQVILNLLSNAIKYTKNGGNIDVSVAQMNSAKEGFAEYVFQVKDNGIGIDEAFMKNLFTPFEREKNSTISGIQGTGLGMSITKSIVDMMKGTITVNSKVGVGSVFTVRVELKTGEGLAVEKKQMKLSNYSFAGKRALMVEDNLINQEIGKSLLESAGVVVEVAENGADGVAALKKSKPGYFDIVLMDIQMPVMNGYQATRAIRALEDEQLRNVPIIAMTANAFDEDRRKSKEAGMNGHISKPIDVAELFRVLNEMLV